MRHWIIIVLILSFSFKAETQNLILNPSFEEQSSCPEDLGELYKAFFWKAVGQTPDLFDTCGTDKIISPIPVHIPSPEFGAAFGSILTAFPFRLRNDTIFREYMQGTLATTLDEGTYFLTFNVLSFPRNRTNHLDVYFSNNDLDSIGPYPKGIIPQFRLEEWIGAYDHWKKHCGCIENIAEANFFTVGNFYQPGQDSVEFANVDFANRIYLDNFGLYRIPDYQEKDTCVEVGTCIDLGTTINEIPVQHLLKGETITSEYCAESSGMYEIETQVEGCSKIIRKFKVTVVEEKEKEPEPEAECNWYLPNSFSPNGDGINDRFTLYINCNTEYQIKRFSVFNRWGAMIYTSTSDNTIDWDGRKNGHLLQSGVYVWLLEYEVLNKGISEQRTENGDVLIWR